MCRQDLCSCGVIVLYSYVWIYLTLGQMVSDSCRVLLFSHPVIGPWLKQHLDICNPLTILSSHSESTPPSAVGSGSGTIESGGDQDTLADSSGSTEPPMPKSVSAEEAKITKWLAEQHEANTARREEPAWSCFGTKGEVVETTSASAAGSGSGSGTIETGGDQDTLADSSGNAEPPMPKVVSAEEAQITKWLAEQQEANTARREEPTWTCCRTKPTQNIRRNRVTQQTATTKIKDIGPDGDGSISREESLMLEAKVMTSINWIWMAAAFWIVANWFKVIMIPGTLEQRKNLSLSLFLVRAVYIVIPSHTGLTRTAVCTQCTDCSHHCTHSTDCSRHCTRSTDCSRHCTRSTDCSRHCSPRNL